MRSTAMVLRLSLTSAANACAVRRVHAPAGGHFEPTPPHSSTPICRASGWPLPSRIPTAAATRLQYSPEGEAKLEAFAAQFSSIPETGAWCYGTGMPSVMLSTVSYPIEIVQHASRLVMLAELEMQVRRVYLDGRPHPDDFPADGRRALRRHVGRRYARHRHDVAVRVADSAVAAVGADAHRRARASDEARRHRGPRDRASWRASRSRSTTMCSSSR